MTRRPDERLDLVGSLPFISVHAGLLLLPFAEFSWTAAGAAAGLYLVRMFGITAGFHRYFSHRSYRTGRAVQFLLALLGTSAGQMGPLWWAAHHRGHHAATDTENDPHSPSVKGFWWAHMGWILCKANESWDPSRVKDWTPFPELVFLTRFHALVPVGLAAALFAAGQVLAARAPALGTGGLQLLAWGFFLSTVLLYHATFSVNSLAHVWGSRRYATKDTSRNNPFIALLTLGEGWHNNHHHYPISERQGFFWWEFDPTHYLLRAASWMGLVRGLHGPAPAVLAAGTGGGR